MLFAARGAALEVGVHPGERLVGVAAGELDVDVEPLEALLAADLGPGRAEQCLDVRAHSDPSRCARSLRRASCSAL